MAQYGCPQLCGRPSYDGFWLHRQLEAHGVRNYVIDPASLQVDRRVRQAKTDRIDTVRLLRSLMAYLRGEPKVWSVVQVPSVAEEDARRLHRERDRFVSERVQHVNRIKALCALQGIYDYHPLRPQAMARLEQLRTAQGIALPPRLKSEIKRELHRLTLVVEMIATLSGSSMAPFSHPAHRTGRADRPHPALGQELTPSPTARPGNAAGHR